MVKIKFIGCCTHIMEEIIGISRWRKVFVTGRWMAQAAGGWMESKPLTGETERVGSNAKDVL